MKAAIIAALQKLDPATDEHWNIDGQPKVEAVQSLMGVDGGSVTRADIIDAAPEFTRSSPELDDVDAEPDVSEEEVKKGDERVKQIRQEVDALNTQIGELQKKKTALVAESDDIISRRPKGHRNSHVGVVQQYLRQQRRNLEAGRGRPAKEPVRVSVKPTKK